MRLIMLAAAIASVATPVSAQTADSQPALTVSGETEYEVWCTISPSSGDEVTRYLDPRRPTLPLKGARSAHCRYKVADEAITLTLTGAGWSCPFKGAQTECQMIAAKRAFGEFDLHRKTS